MSERKNKPKKFKKRGQDSSSSSSSSSESTSSLSSDEESNAGDLKPIKEYLTDRRELARQLFLAVKGDKLRMMLPQVLKKMELSELEEWCSNELSGMSKARIMCILNGQPMLQSSDSNDSDDSGPSLEIISDTEEWGDGSDLEVASREEESAKKSRRDKSRVKLIRDKDKGKAKVGKVSKVPKGKIKSENEAKGEAVKVKKEAETAEQGKEKDGESLLDLLELEMRARAIRALIRKEEDIIPANPSTSEASANPGSETRQKNRQLSLKVVQDKLQELDTNFNRNLAKATQEASEEEDVVLVLEPTTTIELLSSESEGEGSQGKRRNQKFRNERILDEGETEGTEKETEKTVEAVDDQSKKTTPTETEAEKSVQNEDKEKEKEKEKEDEESKKEKEKEKEEEKKVLPKASEVGEVDEDKSNDLEIVIDLDDYPDDMENAETSEKKKSKKAAESLTVEKRPEVDDAAGQTSAETWATRYYQTDDVQSVMKESKIQSEIRKRLRERQRLARLNNSPSLNAALQTSVAAAAATAEKGNGEKEDSPTTGSVEEYLALKNVETPVSAPEVNAVLEKDAETVPAKETENIEDPVVPVAETEAEEKKVVEDDTKAAESVDEENEDGEIVDKVE